MNKVAIVFTDQIYNRYSDDYGLVAQSITEWEEVSDADLKLLNDASSRKGFEVIRQPTDTKDYIAKTVSEQIKVERNEEEKRKEDKKKEKKQLLCANIKKI